MIARLGKLIGYTVAPKKTFAALHPFKFVKWLLIAGVVRWAFKGLTPRRSGKA